MKKTREIIYSIAIILAAVSVASAGTLLTEDEINILDNWNKNIAVEVFGVPEGYSEPESAKNSEYNVNNTLFNKDEWEILGYWRKGKSDNKLGEPEGYSEPESENRQEIKLSNTFFTKGELEMLETF